jgi:hypothetical protein
MRHQCVLLLVKRGQNAAAFHLCKGILQESGGVAGAIKMDFLQGIIR